MLASLRKYLNDNLPLQLGDGSPYVLKFEQYLEAADWPSITIQDLGIPNLGAWAFDDYLGRDDSNNPIYGKKNQTMIELSCQSNETDTDKAVQQVYQMHDQLEYLFYYASSGQLDDNGVRIMPRIALLDFDNGQVDTGSTIYAPVNQDAMWLPVYIGTDPAQPNIKKVLIRVRINWDWRRPAVTSQ